MHCMLITLEPQWTECEHNESAGSNCEDNTTFIFTLKEQRDASEPETCTASGNLYELTAPIRQLKLQIQHALCEESPIRITEFFLSQYVNIKNQDMHAMLNGLEMKAARRTPEFLNEFQYGQICMDDLSLA